MKKLEDFPIGTEIVYIPNLIKHKAIHKSWIVQNISVNNNLVCGVKDSEGWTGIQEKDLDSYMTIDDVKINYPEYFV